MTASVLAPLAISGIFFLPLQLFILMVAGITLVGLWEWTKFVTTSSRLDAIVLPSIFLIGSIFAWPLKGSDPNTFSNLASGITFIGALWWLVVAFMVVRYPKGIGWWEKKPFLQQGFGVLTLVPFLWSVALLRAYQYDIAPYLGAKLVFLVCLLVWTADSGAYFAGKRYGKRKMAPTVSPNKTVEGLIGGLITAVLVTLLGAKLLAIPFASIGMLSFIAIVTSFSSVLGDLAESMFKRVAGVKDSGRILPGHGGILDRIDSLTAAFPVFAVLYFWLS